MASPVADIVGCPSGGVIAAGRHIVSLNTALMGDSLTDDSYGLSNFYTLNALCGGQMVLLANSGISGNTVENMNARVDNDYLNAAPGMAGLGIVGRIFVRAGTNNARGDIPISSLAGAYTTLLNKLAGYAQRVIILAVPPLANANNNATAATYNAWLADFAASNPSKFKFIDDCIDCRNADGSQKADAFNADGVHFKGVGVARSAITAAAALYAELGSYPSPLSKDSADVYPAKPQWFANPTIAGTSGTKDGGFTGSVANNLWIGNYGSGMIGVCSIVAADAGDPNQTPWQRIALTSGQVGSRLEIASTLVGRAITSADPERLDAIAEIRVTNLDRDSLSSFSVLAQANTGEYLVPAAALYLDNTGTETKNYVLRARRKRSGATTPSSIGWHLYATVRAAFGPLASVGTIDVRCITVRG